MLGSGGSQPTPKAGCDCRVCRAARLEGGKHVRGGPSLWLPQAGILVDTPEEANAQLNHFAGGALGLQAVLWSHFHPDHTAGMRVIEYIARWGAGVRAYLPEDLERSLEQIHLFTFLRQEHHIDIHRIEDRVPFQIGTVQVTAFRHAGGMPMYSFLFEESGQRLLYNADHFMTLEQSGLAGLEDLDVAVLQVGLMPDGVQERTLPPDHPARKVLLPISRVLEIAQGQRWRKVVFTHLYEAIRLLPEEYGHLGQRFSNESGFEVVFGWDGLHLMRPTVDGSLEAMSVPELLERLRLQRETIEREYANDRPRLRSAMRALMESPEQKMLEARTRKG